jgi:hypothetical protein
MENLKAHKNSLMSGAQPFFFILVLFRAQKKLFNEKLFIRQTKEKSCSLAFFFFLYFSFHPEDFSVFSTQKKKQKRSDFENQTLSRLGVLFILQRKFVA